MGKTSYAPIPDHVIDELSKLKPDRFTPEHSSETLEIISRLYRKRKWRKWRRWIAGSALAFTAACIIGAAVWNNRRGPAPECADENEN